MKKEKRKKHKIILMILVIALTWFAISWGSSALESLAVQTMAVSSSNGSKGYDDLAFVCVKERLISADNGTELTPIKEEGQRIAKDHAVFYTNTVEGKQYYYAPISGMVSYMIDGYESIKEPAEIAKLDLKHVYDARFEMDEQGVAFEDQGVRAKVIQTMGNVLVYCMLPQDEYLNSLELGTSLKLTLQGREQAEELRGKVVCKDECTIGEGSGYILGLDVGITKEWLYHERVVKLRLIYEENNEMLIPKGALVMREDEAGVYYLRKKFVVWQEITILEERDTQVVIEGLEEGTEIVLNPQRATEGKYVR